MKAFPLASSAVDEYGETTIFYQNGMDLRDYFAAKALPSCITHWVNCQNKNEEAVHFSPEHETYDAELVASEAYGIADAMMKAREQ